MKVPCHTTQHCAYHGFCRRCDPHLAEIMSNINIVIQRGCAEPGRHGALYADIAKVVQASFDHYEETVVGDLNDANIQLARDLARRNIQLSQYLTQLHQEVDHSDEHVYLSTGCLHDNHEYCKSMTGIQGTKRPGRCKQCDAQCICTCHTEEQQ